MPDPEVDSTPPKRKSRLPVAVAVTLVVVLGGAGSWFWMNSPGSTNASAGSSSVAYTVPLETFVVNLSGGEHGYLRVGIALGLSRAPQHKDDLPVALTRDTILSVLSAVKAEQLAQPDGKSKLKAELLQALKERAPQLGVEDVYFTEFLVQQ